VEFTQIADFVTPTARSAAASLPDIVLFGGSIPTEKFSEASAPAVAGALPHQAGSSLVVNSGIRLLTSLQAPTLW
jgi:hypothetical protein